MDLERIKRAAIVVLGVLVSNCVWAIDVEYHTIGGAGPDSFRFAIFADPHAGGDAGGIKKPTEAVDKVIEINNDGDGKVDAQDLAILVEHWLEGCE